MNVRALSLLTLSFFVTEYYLYSTWHTCTGYLYRYGKPAHQQVQLEEQVNIRAGGATSAEIFKYFEQVQIFEDLSHQCRLAMLLLAFKQSYIIYNAKPP